MIKWILTILKEAIFGEPMKTLEVAVAKTEVLPESHFGKEEATVKDLPVVKIKIALDQSIGREKARRLRALGYEIVVTAQDSEPDDVWLGRAFDADALFVISPDLDIPNLIEREGYEMFWIDYLHGQKGLMAEHIHRRIQEKMKFLNGFGDKKDV